MSESSFPYFRYARDAGIPYAEVLRIKAEFDRGENFHLAGERGEPHYFNVAAIFFHEKRRRENVALDERRLRDGSMIDPHPLDDSYVIDGQVWRRDEHDELQLVGPAPIDP